MTSQLVIKGTKYNPDMSKCYVPVNQLGTCSNQVKDMYLSREVVEMVEKMEKSRGHKLSNYDKRSLYLQLSPLYAQSEVRKVEIQQEMKAQREELRGGPLTTWHKDRNTIIRPNPEKAREMIQAMANMHKLIDRMFSPVEKASWDKTASRRLQLV